MNPIDPNNQNGGQPEELPPQNTPDENPPPRYLYPPPAQRPNWQPPPQWQQPPPYQPGYGYPAYPKPGNSALILVLGILSLGGIVCCGVIGLVLGPISWVMANNALQDINAGLTDPMQRGNVVGGRVCGIIGTALGAIYIVIIIVAIAAGYGHPPSP